MMATVTIAELLLAAQYADQAQAIHWPRCRARGRMEDCLRCEYLEDEVVRTDQNLRHWMAARRTTVEVGR